MGPFDRFNDRAKRVLALAQDEAIRFNHNYMGTEHLLLGLVREGEGIAARTLDALNVDLSRLRRTIEAMISRGDSTTSPSEITLTPQLKTVIQHAIDEARKLGHSHVGTEHLLLGIALAGNDTPGGRALESLGLTLDHVVHQVIATIGQPHREAGGSAPGPVPPQSTRSSAGPFDRFNDRAKRVLALAQDEAIRFNHNYIGSEHLLIGLIREEEGVAARALSKLGLELEKARQALEYIIGRGDTATAPSEITLSPRTKKIIELSIEESRKLGHSHVGTEHMLLGLAREGEGIASGILESLGITMNKVRHAVIEILGQMKPNPSTNVHANTLIQSGPFDLLDDAAKRVLSLAEEEARQMRHNWIGTEHMMIAILRSGSVAQRALESLGVTLDQARAGVFKAVPPKETDVVDVRPTPRVKTLIGRAIMLAGPVSDQVRPQHLLLALVADPDGVGSQVLEQLGATQERVRQRVDKLP
jgi:ATP-dependent Clp protease ATP-binding subunit ClpA